MTAPDHSAQVLFELSDGLAEITLNRPRQRNAVDDATVAAFADAVERAATAPGCRVIVIRGSGPVFCAGWDLKAIAASREAGDAAASRASLESNRRVLDRLRDTPQVVVALVQGAALGFGLGLLTRADIVLADSAAIFGLPEIAVGVVPAIVMLDVHRHLAEKTALDWLLTGARHTAEEAAQAGLVTRVSQDLERDGRELVAQLLAHDGEALLSTKALFRRLGTLDDEAATAVAIDTAVKALT